MSCRWRCATASRAVGAADVDPGGSDTVATYLDLARAGRKDDFQWFGRSQGLPDDKIEELWRVIVARLAAA